MRKASGLLLLGILVFGILFLAMVSVVSAQVQQQDFTNPTSNWQYSQPNFQSYYSSEQIRTYWPVLNDIENDQCTATSDFLVAIRPGGCTPMTVRSDLLEEQNVPVFCQLDAVRVNPLIKVSSIKSISFKGEYPEGVTGISFHPARAAIKSYRTLLGSPLLNNIGYVVIVLKKTKTEEEMPDWISGNLTATVYYDAENVYGTGRGEYYLPVMSDANWSTHYKDYGFWYGRGFLRVKDVGDGNAKIVLYTDQEKVFQEVTLEEGKTSSLMYFPGFYCRAGLKVKLNKVVAPENQAKLNIDGQDIWVRRGSKILNNKCTVTKIDAVQDGTGNISISCRGGQKIKLSLEELEDEGEDKEEELTGALKTYFDEASETVNKLVDDFPAEGGRVEKYGEIALLEQARLAEELGKQKTAKQLYERFIDIYPNSKNIEGVRKDLFRISNFDSTKAYASFFINNNHHTIRVDRFKAVDEGAKTVKISISRIGTENYNENVSKEIILAENDKFSVKKIEPNQVTLVFHSRKDAGSSWKSETKTLKERDSINRGGREIMIQQINVNKIAYVSLIPEIKKTKTEANFTFKIGIEKRAIQLSPEKTEDMIRILNESVEKWEEINEKLGNVIKSLKGACFVTSTALMLKNLMSGFSGESMARQKVMKKYKSICDTEYSGMTHTECYNELAPEINQDVTAMKKAIEDTNTHISNIEEQHQTGKGWLGMNKVVNHSGALEDYRDSFEDGTTVNITVDGQTVEMEVDNINSFTQLREVELLNNLKKAGASDVMLEGQQESINSQLTPAYRLQEADRKRKELEDRMEAAGGLVIPVSVLTQGEKSIVYSGTSEGFEKEEFMRAINQGGSKTNVEGILKDKKNVGAQIVHIDTESYLVLMEPQPGQGAVRQLGIFDVQVGTDGKLTVTGEKKDSLPQAQGVSIISISGGECSNKYLNPKVRFYETSPDVHLPAIVPFDINDGWYVKVPQSVGGLLGSGAGGYRASGDVSFFYICNVGENGRMDNMKDDDICQSFDVNTYSSVDKFIGCPTLSASNIQQLARKARGAIREAAQQFGKSSVGISNVGNFLVDAPMTGTGELVECQDFMSPGDCKLLFNVCDPVICPSSRCNLGGKYPVANVVQTGIIGSLVLCLPNLKEGVIVPICLTGVHAGLDSYLSILKSEKDCLQRSLDTGEHVGICDEITSVYLCEFFWRQLSPVINIIIPKLIESAYGMQGARGGGEYLTVMNAWQTMEKSISYFKNTYAQNAFRAFQFGSIEEAGGTFCRAFIGTSVPTSASFLDKLLEPESPEQFYARFSETTFSDATVPPTSHYKVYYHIFAGNNKGVHYSVYLKNPPATSYYQANPVVQVKTGYVAKGESADESVDITAPSGYKELCVVIDTQTRCGFKQVTTNFGLDYLEMKYTEEQAGKKEIVSEKECISGSPSMLALVNPSVQAGVEEAIQPQIALRGIVRICATQNPGASTDTKGKSRWQDVGYCDDENIRCWLDSESVREDIEQVQAIDRTLAGTQEDAERLHEGVVLTPDATRDKLNKLKEEINGLDNELKLKEVKTEAAVEGIISGIISRLTTLIGGPKEMASSNAGIGEALGLKANVYQIVVRALDKGKPPRPELPAEEPEETPVEEEEEKEEEEVKRFSLSEYNRILDNGGETAFYLKETEAGKYVIWLARPDSSDRIIGMIKDKNIDINIAEIDIDNNKKIAEELEDYNFENGEFKELGVISVE